MPHASKERSFLARVRSALSTLHPAERRLGEFVCDFPGEIASYDAQKLAKFAGVSNATVSRFVRRLGYESYETARKHAREEQAEARLARLCEEARDRGARAIVLGSPAVRRLRR